MNVKVSRSPIRMLGYAALAVPAILLSVDMLIAHRWYPEPDATNQVVGSTLDVDGNGVDITVRQLTADGRSQQRRDRLLGAALLAGGVAAMAWSLNELVRPTVVVRADDEGLSVRVDGPGRPPRLFPWEDVVEVRSGLRDDDGTELPVLSLHLADPDMVPGNPAGGEADPPWLHLFADDWEVPAHQVAPVLDQMTGRVRPEGSTE